MITTTRRRHAALRAPTTYSDGGLQVDEQAGVLRNIALITAGPAKGHPFEIDQTTVEQLVDFINAAGADGVKSRWKHPAVTTKTDPEGNLIQEVADDTGSLIGVVKNARVVGSQARGDLILGDYSRTMPGLGDVRSYILGIAKQDPGKLGISAFFPYEVEPIVDSWGNVLGRPARIIELVACDLVSSPAANPHGLLSAKPTAMFDPQPEFPDSSGWSESNPQDLARAPIPEDSDGFYADTNIMDELTAMDDEQIGLLIDVGDLAAGEGDDPDTNEPLEPDDAEVANVVLSRLSRRGVGIYRALDCMGKLATKSSIYRAAHAVRLARQAARVAAGTPNSDVGRPPRPAAPSQR
ncbi:MAG TPA: hypothetical protein VK797_07325 [Tepidisphaeraceae bacterium]|jgi:hypothetical protein|nr:hypothetical protein [Tepidisphaeraceae bacterium]